MPGLGERSAPPTEMTLQRAEPREQPDAACPFDPALGDECDAFLEGRYVDWLRTAGLPIPIWTRLNRAAHADRQTVGAHAAAAGAASPPKTWPEVELLVNAAVHAGIPEKDFEVVQRSVLVPLELDLMHRSMSPRALLERVCEAIYSCTR